MKKNNLLPFLIFFYIHFSLIIFAEIRLDEIKLPKGFRIEIFADNIETARGLAISPSGTVFVGSKNGNVYALIDSNKDGKVDKKYLIVSGLTMPVGLDYYKGDLYVSALNKIIRFDNIESRLENPPKYIVINDSFPTDTHHGWKFIKFGPDDKLYVPVGAPCNVCEQKDSRYASIMRMNPDGSNLELFASGVRNTVGFDWDPGTNELWFTDNGRDNLGDNIPPDELNHASKKSLHFGFPYFHGNGIRDPQFGQNKNSKDFIPPAIELGPHVASLGMRFYRGKMFPDRYKNQIFIAEHGSWNRSIPIGYRITLVTLDKNKAVKYEIFAEGWLKGGKSWGRPVDVEVNLDDSLLVSDDKANAIYRIYYEP